MATSPFFVAEDFVKPEVWIIAWFVFRICFVFRTSDFVLRTGAGITVVADAASVGSDAGSIRHEETLIDAPVLTGRSTSSTRQQVHPDCSKCTRLRIELVLSDRSARPAVRKAHEAGLP